jgi:hypothetical protein
LTRQSGERSPARILLGAILALLLAFAVGNTRGAAAQGEQQEDVFTPVTVSLIGSDSEGAVKGTDGRYHVVYELLLTNAKAVPATLEAVEVLDAGDGTTVLRREGDKLVPLIRTLNAQLAKNALIPPNQSRMVFLTVSFNSEEDIPESLDHRFELKAAANPAATEPSKMRYQAASVDLWDRKVPVFAPPGGQRLLWTRWRPPERGAVGRREALRLAAIRHRLDAHQRGWTARCGRPLQE